MSELIKNRVNSIVQRTPELIAAEINNIKDQTKRMVLYNSIEIGRRLVEVKSLMEHGRWGEWLETSVSYSKSTANNLMRIFEEYGADQMTLLLDNNAKSEAYEKLSYTQAVALLGMPEEDREAFINENDIENMSTRELQQAIKEKEQALKEKELIESEKEQIEKQKEELLESWKKDQDEKLQKINELEDKLKDNKLSDEEREEYENKLKLQKEIAAANKLSIESKEKQIAELKAKNDEEIKKEQKAIEDLKKKIKELETKSLEVQKGATPEEVEKIKSDTAMEYEKQIALLKAEKELAEKRQKELEINVAKKSNESVFKYSVYFDEIVKSFQELLKALAEIKESDTELHEKYKKAVSTLISKMQERL